MMIVTADTQRCAWHVCLKYSSPATMFLVLKHSKFRPECLLNNYPVMSAADGLCNTSLMTLFDHEKNTIEKFFGRVVTQSETILLCYFPSKLELLLDHEKIDVTALADSGASVFDAACFLHVEDTRRSGTRCVSYGDAREGSDFFVHWYPQLLDRLEVQLSKSLPSILLWQMAFIFRRFSKKSIPTLPKHIRKMVLEFVGCCPKVLHHFELSKHSKRKHQK